MRVFFSVSVSGSLSVPQLNSFCQGVRPLTETVGRGDWFVTRNRKAEKMWGGGTAHPVTVAAPGTDHLG